MKSTRNEGNKKAPAVAPKTVSVAETDPHPSSDLTALRHVLELRTQELAQSLSVLRATLQLTPDGVLVTDHDGRITDFNDNYARMWGLAPDVMAQRDDRTHFQQIGHQTRDDSAFAALVERIRMKSPLETFDVVELADGREFEMLSRTRLADGHPIGRVWSFRDISARRYAERDHAHLAAIVASSTDAIVSKSLNGIVTSWNIAAERMFGYTASEIIGKPITILIPPEHLGQEEEFLRRIRSGELIDHFETIRRRKDGNLINVSLTISPVRDSSGKIIGASKIVRDVTEREELLARERAARSRAEEASRLKDEFLATVSHEVRTPLNAILGWAKLLQLGSLTEEKAAHAAQVIERNALAQAQVIEDLLDVSRIITGKLRLDMQPIFPKLAIESALDSVRPMAEAKGVALSAALDVNAGPISGDASRLQQIVWNLLSNAIKFTPRGGRADVRLEHAGSNVEITVSDTGEGLSAEFLPYAFDRFRQADASASRAAGGVGIGLAIVRHLVELHGGSVKVHSAGKEQGATFIVTLPMREAHGASEGEEPPRRSTKRSRSTSHALPNLEGARVLVVDDEIDARGLLREMLEQCGAEVREAGSAGQAFEICRDWQPTVLVSDIGMPGEDGYSLIRKIREWENTYGSWIPAVALTAYARSEDRARALQEGYQVHTTKPVEPLAFAEIVAGLIRLP